MNFICRLIGHKEVSDHEYPVVIHPIPREFTFCERCHQRTWEETFDSARSRAAKAFQVLMAEDDK